MFEPRITRLRAWVMVILCARATGAANRAIGELPLRPELANVGFPFVFHGRDGACPLLVLRDAVVSFLPTDAIAAPAAGQTGATSRPSSRAAATTAPSTRAASKPATQTLPADAGVDAAGLFRAGRDALAAGSAERAVELLSDAVARRPDEPAYQLKLADAYAAADRRDAAMRLLQNVVQRDPQSLAARTALGRLYRDAGRFEAAMSLLSPAEQQLDEADLVLLVDCMTRAGKAAAAQPVVERGLQRFPRCEPLWLALADAFVDAHRLAGALEVVGRARVQIGDTPGLAWRAAQAYFGLGQTLGEVFTRRIEGGVLGQFSRAHLVIDRGRAPGEFICVPPESALYQVRRALDGGIDLPAAHLMHARIWQSAGKPRIAFEILKAREAAMFEFEAPTSNEAAGVSVGSAVTTRPARTVPPAVNAELLDTYTQIAFDADAFSDFLRLSRRRAEATPARRETILKSAYLALAEKYNERGDEKMFVECLTRASELAPGDMPLMLRRADAAWDADRKTDAAACYRRVLEADPQHARRKQMLERIAAEP